MPTPHTHVLTRKEMKGPDRFQVIAGQAASWMATRRKQIALAGGLVVAALVVAAVVAAFQKSREENASTLLYKALDAMDGEISSVPLPGVTKPLFKTDEERQRAVLSGADEVRKRYPSTEPGRTAALAAGDAHLRLGEHDAAIASYEAFLDGAPKTESLRFAALEGIAYAQEGKGAFAEAARTFERMGTEAPAFKDRAALERARVLARGGKTDDAKRILASFADDFKDSPLKVEAQERLDRLGGK